MTPPPSATCTTCATCDPRRTRPPGTACRCRPAQSCPVEPRSSEPRDWTPWWTSLAANA